MSAPANWQSFVDNLTPDLNPDGSALSNPATGVQATRYFIFGFTTTNTTSINAYMTGNTWAGTEEFIISIYLASDITRTNLINSTNITNIQPSVTLNTTDNTIRIASNFSNLAFTLENLQSNTSYLLVTQTTYNDIGIDIGMYMYSIQTLTKIPLLYFETSNSTSIFTPISNLPEWTSLVTNVIPDYTPNGSTLTNPAVGVSAQRFFKFSFTPINTTSANLYIITNISSLSQEYIYRLYPDGQFNTIFDGNNISNVQTGITFDSSRKYCTVDNNYSNLAFTFYNLTSNIPYSLITRTTFNNAGIDMGFYLESVTSSNQIPLTYIETSSNTSLYQPTVPTNPEIPYVTLNSITINAGSDNDITGLNPNLNPPLVSYPLILYHNVDFQYGSYRLRWNNQSNTVSIIDGSPAVVFSYDSNLGRYIVTSDVYSRPIIGQIWFSAPLTTTILVNLKTVNGITYDSDINAILAISYPLTLFDNIDYSFESNIYTLRYINGTNEIYFYSSGTLILKFIYNSTNKVWNIYYDLYNRANLLNNTVFFMTNTTDITFDPPSGWQSTVTSLIPDTNPDSSPLASPGLENGIRYFVFSFSTGTSSNFDAFITSLAATAGLNSIVSIYKSGSTNNSINSTTITNLQSNVTLNTSNKTISFGNSFNGLAFSIYNLDINSTYYIIAQTTSNQVGADIGLYLQSRLDANSPTLLYESTSNLQILYKNSFYSTTNIIPDANPDSSPLVNPALGEPGDRFYRFSFTTPNTTSVTFYFTSESNQESIVYFFKENSFKNLLSIDNLINITSAITFDAQNSSIQINTPLAGVEGFTLQNLSPNTTYYFFSKTTFNTSGSDVGIAILSRDTDTFISTITYEATGNTQLSVQFTPTLPDIPFIYNPPDAEDSKITFYWSYPLSDGYSPITSYLLSSISHNCNIVLQSSAEFTLSSLTNNTEYSFQIASSNSVGLSPFAVYRSVTPGTLPLPMEISTMELNENTGRVTINAILNSTINTPPIKYIIYTTIPQGESRFNYSNIQSNIFTTNQSTSIITLNKELNWNIYAASVADTGYSEEVSTSISFPRPETPESIFFRTSLNSSNHFLLFRSTLILNTTTLPLTTDWTVSSWRTNAFGLGIIQRNVANTRIYRCQFVNKFGETISTSGSFFGPVTASNYFGPADGSLMYGLFPSTNSLLNYVVYNFSTNTLVLSTLQNVSTLSFLQSGGTLYSNFAFLARSNTTATISNLYTFQCDGSNTNTYHPIYLDSFGTTTATSNTIDRKFYLFGRPPTFTSGNYNKIYCFNNSTSYVSFNINSLNFAVLSITNLMSPNFLNITEGLNGKNLVFNFDLPEANNPILSNTVIYSPISQFTRFSPTQQAATSLFSFHRGSITVNSQCNLAIFAPSSSNYFSTPVNNTSYLTGNSTRFNVTSYFNPSLFVSFATLDIAGNFSTYTTNFLSNLSFRTSYLSNDNTVIFRLSNSATPNSTILYSFHYFNSTIHFFSTLVNSNAGSFFNFATSNSLHNYFNLPNGFNIYIPPGGPLSTLGITAQIYRNLLPPNNTAFAINSNTSEIFVFSNASLVSTVNASLATPSNLLLTSSKDACFFFSRTGGPVFHTLRVSTNGLLTSASNTQFSNQFSTISFENINTSHNLGMLMVHAATIGPSSVNMATIYNYTQDTFENFSIFSAGTSNINTFSNSFFNF
jgi:hypothetical protein